MSTWDQTVDVLVAGSGGAGLAAAMTAGDAGLSVLVVESTDRWGGSTAMSGGGMWLPATRSWRATAPATPARRRSTYLEADRRRRGPGHSPEREGGVRRRRRRAS